VIEVQYLPTSKPSRPIQPESTVQLAAEAQPERTMIDVTLHSRNHDRGHASLHQSESQAQLAELRPASTVDHTPHKKLILQVTAHHILDNSCVNPEKSRESCLQLS
jgi:hypothetical protein